MKITQFPACVKSEREKLKKENYIETTKGKRCLKNSGQSAHNIIHMHVYVYQFPLGHLGTWELGFGLLNKGHQEKRKAVEM